MPSIRKNDDKRQCWECVSYEIRVPGGAYCTHHEKFFPNNDAWAWPDTVGTMPGLRTCKFWKVKIVDLNVENLCGRKS